MPARSARRAATAPTPGVLRHRVWVRPGVDVHVVEWPAAPHPAPGGVGGSRGGVSAPAAGTPTVVLAHGWTLTHASWLPVVERLRAAHGVRVVAFDQPGHGLSGPEWPTPSVHELGGVLHRVLTALVPTGPLVLAGHSMGGMTVMAWSADHAQELAARVRGVLLVSTAAHVGADRVHLPLELQVMRASARAPRVRPGRLLSARSQTRLLYGREAAREAVDPGIRLIRRTSLPAMGRWFMALQDHDEREALAHLATVPTRILVGSADRLTTVRQAWELSAGIRGSRLTVLPGLGHMLTYEAPDAVASALGGLLTNG